MTFDPELPYRMSSAVAVRPESFGALLYDFRTRRLSFLKSPTLVAVVTALADHDDVHSTLDDSGVAADQRPALLTALATLADSGTIEPR